MCHDTTCLLIVLDGLHLVHRLRAACEDGNPSLRQTIGWDCLAWVEVQADDVLNGLLCEERGLVDLLARLLGPFCHQDPKIVPM